MEKQAKLANTLVTRSIDWQKLAAIAGMCLKYHDLAEPIVENDSRSLAEEFTRQAARAAIEVGIDPLDKNAEGLVEFSVPVWAVCFVVDIMHKLEPSGPRHQVAAHWRPFANAALEVVNNFGSDPDELPAYRMN